MELVIMKFGGTSVADSDSVRRVLDIVKNEKRNKLVVVSAIAKATTALETIALCSSQGKRQEAESQLGEITDRHYRMIDELISSSDYKIKATEKIEAYHSNITELIYGLSVIKDLSLRTLDAFRVFGELMSSAVIYYAMIDQGIKAELIDSREVIKTNSDFSRAYPDFRLSEIRAHEKIRPLIDNNKVVLAQGFIGSTEDGIPTTMGRESSDFSAAIYGALLDAAEIQIWTDVDGVLTSDPNIIKDALKLSEISFPEMEELANFGAKVLHKNSVKPARDKNIPIRILNSKNTASSGTLICTRLNYHELVKSITYKKNIIVLRIKPAEYLNQYIFWEMMLNILTRHKPQIDILLSSSNSIIIIISENAYTRIHYDELKNEFTEIAECEIIKDKALVTLVGSDLNSIKNLEQKIFISIPDTATDAVAFGFNKHSFSLLVDAECFESTITNLHRAFFKDIEKSCNLFEKINKTEEKQIA